MARFGVYRSPGSEGYLVDVQSDFLDYINTRIVVPLQPVDTVPQPIPRLNPTFEVREETLMLVPQHMLAVPSSVLGSSIFNLSPEADKITSAVDFLMQGF